MAISLEKVGLHLCFADHTISGEKRLKSILILISDDNNCNTNKGTLNFIKFNPLSYVTSDIQEKFS